MIALVSSGLLSAQDPKNCRDEITELKSAGKVGQEHFVESEMPKFEQADKALAQGFTEPMMNLLKEWGRSSVPRPWIRGLPINWDKLIHDLSTNVILLKPTEATTPKGQQSPFEISHIFQTHTLGILMKLFRDQDFSDTPDAFAIQENWITWGMKQPLIEVHDDNENLLIARRAQMAFEKSFREQFVSSQGLFEKIEWIRTNLDLMHPGLVAFAGRELQRISEDPEDNQKAASAMKISKRFAEKYFEIRMNLSRIEEQLHSEYGKDRAYAPLRFLKALSEIEQMMKTLDQGISPFYDDLYSRILLASGASLETDTPAGELANRTFQLRMKNAQLSHQAGLIAAAEHGDFAKMQELLSVHLIPAASVKNPLGKDLWEISKDQPRIRELLKKFFGRTNSIYLP